MIHVLIFSETNRGQAGGWGDISSEHRHAREEHTTCCFCIPNDELRIPSFALRIQPRRKVVTDSGASEEIEQDTASCSTAVISRVPCVNHQVATGFTRLDERGSSSQTRAAGFQPRSSHTNGSISSGASIRRCIRVHPKITSQKKLPSRSLGALKI